MERKIGEVFTYKGKTYKVIKSIGAGDVFFKNSEDTQAVIDNPNFRDILDTIYKD